MQSDWPMAFWPIFQKPDFSQTRDLCRNIANSIKFHYRQNSGKLMTNFFNKFKKTCFWPIFEVIFFSKKPTLPCKTSYWFLKPCQNLEKTNDPIQRKNLDSQTRGDTPYFTRPFQLLRGVQKSRP